MTDRVKELISDFRDAANRTKRRLARRMGTSGSRPALEYAWHEATSVVPRSVRNFESASGAEVEDSWLNRLALHTQVVTKSAPLNWQHGRVLYSALIARLTRDNGNDIDQVTVFETGTAKGFSAVVMARALLDLGKPGTIISVDVQGHYERTFVDCIDCIDSPKSRAQLLDEWKEESSRILFIRGTTSRVIRNLGLNRICFAFLDAEHNYVQLRREVAFVAARQVTGDIIVLDDANPRKFPGVAKAVRELSERWPYRTQTVSLGGGHIIVVATRY